MEAHDHANIVDEVFSGMQVVERNDALKFAANTLENLQLVKQV